MWSDSGFACWKRHRLTLTRAELGPGTSPLVSGVSDSLRFKSSENSWVTGVGGCWGVKTEDGPGRDMLSFGSSSVMSSQDCRSSGETQPWKNNKASNEMCVERSSPGTAVYLQTAVNNLYVLSHCPGPWAPSAHSRGLHWCGVSSGKHDALPDGSAAADRRCRSQKSHPWRKGKWLQRK